MRNENISYNSNVAPNCAPMRDITLRNLSYIDLDIESKTDDIKGHSILKCNDAATQEIRAASGILTTSQQGGRGWPSIPM